MTNIFVSSTFADMDDERDLLQQFIAPSINRIAQEYGETIHFCDLRWGIDTVSLDTQHSTYKVVSTCLQEVERCKPFFLLFLGERYGWIPDATLVSQIASEIGIDLSSCLGQSITALELECGPLLHKDRLDNTLIFIRQFQGEIPAQFAAEDALQQERMNQLKARILSLVPERVHYYTVSWDQEHQCLNGMDALAQELISQISQMMDYRWKASASLSPYIKDQHWQKELIRQQYYPSFGQRLLQHYNESLMEYWFNVQDEVDMLEAVCSLTGALEAEGWNILPIICDRSHLCNTVRDLQQYLAYCMEDLIGLEHDTALPPYENEVDRLCWWQDRLDRLVEQYNQSSAPPLIIALPYIDVLDSSGQQNYAYAIPTKLSGKVHMLLCGRHGRLWFRKGYASCPGAPNPQDILEILHRELSSDILSLVEKKTRGRSFYGHFLIQRLCMFSRKDYDQIRQLGGGMDAISLYQSQIIEQCPDSIPEMANMLLHHGACQFDNPDFYEAMIYLAVAHRGLRESDLKALLLRDGKKWNDLDFASYILYLRRYLIIANDGVISFALECIPQGLLQNKVCERYRRQLLNYLYTLPKQDPVAMMQIPYCCVKIGAWPELHRYLDRYLPGDPAWEIASKVCYELLLKAKKRAIDFPPTDHGDTLAQFIYTTFAKEYPPDPDTIYMLSEIFLFNKGRLEDLLRREETVDRYRLLTLNGMQAALNCGESSDDAHHDKGSHLCADALRALDAWTALLDKDGRAQSDYLLSQYAILYHAANLYYKYRKNIEARACCLRIQQMIRENPGVFNAEHFLHLQLVLAKASPRSKRLSICQAALEYYRQLSPERQKECSRYTYICILDQLLLMNIRSYRDIPDGPEKDAFRAQIQEMLDESYTYSQEQHHRKPSPYTARNLALSLVRMADFDSIQGTEEKLVQAAKNLYSAERYIQSALEGAGTYAQWKDLAWIRFKLGIAQFEAHQNFKYNLLRGYEDYYILTGNHNLLEDIKTLLLCCTKIYEIYRAAPQELHFKDVLDCIDKAQTACLYHQLTHWKDEALRKDMDFRVQSLAELRVKLIQHIAQYILNQATLNPDNLKEQLEKQELLPSSNPFNF
ncbi:MAG: DUF4062 domain-containing protein [Oscillospiraceae bacterium]|nr:DUF4062 domain-containing protein [Oscillospiraceae bacterium]